MLQYEIHKGKWSISLFGRTLGHQGVGDHDGVVGTLAHEVVVQSSGGGVAAVTDDLAVHGADAVSCAHQTVCTVVEGRHTVINVGHGARTVGVGHDSLLVGRAAVTDADHHAVGRQILFLAAQYESWSVPVAVILSLPVAGIGAYLGIWVCGLENNIYFQIGLVMLVGLVAKNSA